MADVRRASLFFVVLACVAGCLDDLKPDVGKKHSSTGNQAGQGDGADGAQDDDGEGGEGSGEGSEGGGEGSAGSGDASGDDDGADGTDAGDMYSDGDDGQTGDGDDGDPQGTDCVIMDSDPKRDVSFADDIMPILERCSCHNSNSGDSYAISESGLTIEDYESVRVGGYDSGDKIIVPGNACDSILLQKLGTNPPFGERMPLEGPYLSESEMRLLSDWIVEGARDN